jgi:hypothetical protein
MRGAYSSVGVRTVAEWPLDLLHETRADVKRLSNIRDRAINAMAGTASE